MKLYIGADHRGFELKERIKYWLQEKPDLEVIDCGNNKHDPDDDYPQFSFTVGERVVSEPGALGIVICGSGVGVTFAVNKVVGIRAATAFNINQVIHGRESDDMNVLALESDYLTLEMAQPLIEAFISSEYGRSERSERRLAQISAYEQHNRS